GAAYLAALLLLFQVAAISLDVIVRFFFGFASEVVVPLTSWSLVYIAFLGAAWLQRERGHVALALLTSPLRPGARRWFDLIGISIGAGCCVVLVWYGSTVTWDSFEKDLYDFYGLPYVPIFIVYIIIPLGSLLFLLQLIRDIWSLLTGGKTTLSETTG